MAKCRTCDADIIFGQTTKSPIPLDAKPLKVAVFRQGTNFVDIVDGYVAHFATCPQAAQHRKAKPKARCPSCSRPTCGPGCSCPCHKPKRGAIEPVDDGRIERGAE